MENNANVPRAQGDFVHKYRTGIRPALLKKNIAGAVSTMSSVCMRFAEINLPELRNSFPDGSYEPYKKAVDTLRGYIHMEDHDQIRFSGNLVRVLDQHVLSMQLSLRGNGDYEKARKSI